MALPPEGYRQIGDDRQGGIAPRFGRSPHPSFPADLIPWTATCHLCRPRDLRNAHSIAPFFGVEDDTGELAWHTRTPEGDSDPYRN